jgi:hypothetical protein
MQYLLLITGNKMPFILKNKETEQYRLFGSLPILCSSIGFDEKQEKNLLYTFSQKKESKFENNDFLIVKVVLERGGSN